MSLVLEKQKWRKHFRQVLKDSQNQNDLVLKDLNQSLSQFLKQQVGQWGGYVALPGEAKVDVAISSSSHLQWAYPRVDKSTLKYHDTKVFVEGPWKIQEPEAQSPQVELNKLMGLLIPGLGFSKLGHRLGRGKGFFDFTLNAYTGLKVGVGFHCQFVEEALPTQKHDVAMDWIITNQVWVNCRKEEVHPWKSSFQSSQD